MIPDIPITDALFMFRTCQEHPNMATSKVLRSMGSYALRVMFEDGNEIDYLDEDHVIQVVRRMQAR